MKNLCILFIFLAICTVTFYANAEEQGTLGFLVNSCKLGIIDRSSNAVMDMNSLHCLTYFDGFLDGISFSNLLVSKIINPAQKNICGSTACTNGTLISIFNAWYLDKLKEFKTNIEKQKFKNEDEGIGIMQYFIDMSKKNSTNPS